MYNVTMNRNNSITNDIDEISKSIQTLDNQNAIRNFLLEILTQSELETLSKRWRILKMLHEGETQREIAKALGVSLCKVTRGAKILKDNTSTIANMIKEI